MQPIEALPIRWPTRGTPAPALARRLARHHAQWMFSVTEAEATAIRATFEQEGELSAAVELRRIFPGITDNARARECARIIAGWTPIAVPASPAKVVRLRTRTKD